MTTRSGLLLLVLCGAASAGCGGSVVFSEDGGSGGAGGDDTPNVPSGGAAPSGPSGPVVSVATVGPGPSVTVGGGECPITQFFEDRVCDVCFLESCCAEAEACLDDFESCVTPDGTLDESNRVGAAVVECATAMCSEACGIAPPPTADQLCDSGILLITDSPREDAAFMGCFNASCCDVFEPCHAGGAETQECVDCLNGDTQDLSRCAPADSCAFAACGMGLGARDVCDSGYIVRGIEDGRCAERECCDEARACTVDGQQPEACRDCVDAGSGPLCDDLLACQLAQCGF